jgi:hypothetical protein
MGSHSRNKGKAYEQRIARLYRDKGYKAKRGWQCREGDDDPDVVVDIPLWLECKHHAKGGLAFRAYAQAKEAARLGRMPVVHIHEDRGEHLVVLSEDDWMRVLEAAKGKLFEGGSK